MERVIIDVEGRFTDNITTAASGAVGALERLAKKTVFVKFQADSNPFLKVVKATEQRAQRFGHTKIAATLNVIDKATNILGNVWNFGLKIGGAVWRTTVSVVDKATAPLRGIFRLLKNPVLQVGTALGLSFGANNMIQTYADFESTMSEVGAISGTTDQELAALTAKAKEMGAATKFSASEAGSAMTYMAMAGWKSQDMLDGIEGIMNLAAASGESLATTSDIVTDALTAFGKTAKDSTRFADVMAAASSNANTNVAMLGESFKFVAPVAGAFGFSIEDTALALGLMANAGVKSSIAGTSLRAALTNMLSPSDSMAAAMDKYGVSLANADGSSKDLMGVMQNLRSSFGDMGIAVTDSSGELKDYDTLMSEAANATDGSADKLEKLSALSTIFGKQSLPGMLAIIQASTTDFNKLSDAIYNADGTASRMAATMMDNLKGSMDILKSAAEGAILTIMDKGAPYLRGFIDWLAEKMPKIGEKVGGAFEFIGSKIDWIHGKIQEITGGADFKFGNIGEKIKLLWNGLVVDPLTEWWSNGGREISAEAAGTIGKELGEILKTGLLGIFGLTDLLDDQGQAISAGASIAKRFAEGFAEGFDVSLIVEKFKEALGNIWNAMPGWTKVLTGGIIGSKIIGGLSKVALGGMALYGNIVNTVGSTGNAMVSGSGILGKFADKGYALLGGASFGTLGISGTQAALLGGAAFSSNIGKATAVLTGISAVGDYFNAVKAGVNGDEISAKASFAKGGSKIAGIGVGTLAGVKIGATFGTALGPAGTVIGGGIGAGIGALAGIFAGNKIARNIEAARFESEEMQEAIKNTDMSAEELAQTFQKAVYTDMKSRFGEIELSLSEIQRLSDQIVLGDKQGAYTDFVTAAQASAASMQTFQ